MVAKYEKLWHKLETVTVHLPGERCSSPVSPVRFSRWNFCFEREQSGCRWDDVEICKTSKHSTGGFWCSAAHLCNPLRPFGEYIFWFGVTDWSLCPCDWRLTWRFVSRGSTVRKTSIERVKHGTSFKHWMKLMCGPILMTSQWRNDMILLCEKKTLSPPPKQKQTPTKRLWGFYILMSEGVL